MSEFIGDILKKLAKKDTVIKKIYNTTSIEAIWNTVLENKIRKYAKIEKYETKDKVLVLSCKNNIVMQEILFKKNEIIKKLNDTLKDKIIMDIKVIRR